MGARGDAAVLDPRARGVVGLAAVGDDLQAADADGGDAQLGVARPSAAELDRLLGDVHRGRGGGSGAGSSAREVGRRSGEYDGRSDRDGSDGLTHTWLVPTDERH
jgi:hypothetical protein